MRKNIFYENPLGGLEQMAQCIRTMEGLLAKEGAGALTNEKYDDAEELYLELRDAAEKAGVSTYEKIADLALRYLHIQEFSLSVEAQADFEPLEQTEEMRSYKAGLLLSELREAREDFGSPTDAELRELEGS